MRAGRPAASPAAGSLLLRAVRVGGPPPGPVDLGGVGHQSVEAGGDGVLPLTLAASAGAARRGTV